MIRTLDSISDSIERIITPICRRMFSVSSIVVGIMSVPILIDVLGRYFLGKGIPGTIETEEFMMVIIVFFALAYIQQKKEHIQIDLLVSRLPRWTHPFFDGFNYFISLVLFGVMAWRMILQSIKKWGEVSFSLSLPISIFIALAAFGTILLVLVLASDFIRQASRILKDGHWPLLLALLVAGVAVLLIPWWLKLLPWSFSRLTFGGLGIAFLMVLLLFRMPIGFAMALVGFLGMATLNVKVTSALSTLGIAPYATTSSFILTVVPLFILMGTLAFQAGISQDLFKAANKWLGHLPGGLAMSAVAGCAGFAAVCGDSLATAATMGTVSLPEMRKMKYVPSLACGSLAAGGTLGILIPPSVGFIFYAIVTEESIGKLFIAGLMPGVLMATLFILCLYFIAKLKPELAPRGEAATLRDKIISLKGVIGMLALFVLILGGILAGIFSPTEGGGIGVVGAFVFALLRRKLTWEKLMSAFKESVLITCKLLTILIGVGILGYFLALSRLPFELADLVTSIAVNRYVIFAAVIGLFIILGCLMNVIPMILLTLPAIFPTITALGFDPIWFGVITVIVMEMGQITPPIGVNVFILSSVAKDVPMEKIFKGIIPFFLCMVVCVLILILFPQIALFLPGLFFK